ncbi:MAG: acyl-CoA thioesterase [Alphaproteobacteria bacterium]|nr:acyl-CoA thioesterase [Alphaproteobacteria bacterium]
MGQWMETNRAVVFPAQCDHLGHMNVRYYAHVFDDASFHAWASIGITFDAMYAQDAVTVVAHTATDFIQEVKAGSLLKVETAFVKLGTKSTTYRQRLVNAETGTLHARQQVVEVFFNLKTRQSVAMPDVFRDTIARALVEDAEG